MCNIYCKCFLITLTFPFSITQFRGHGWTSVTVLKERQSILWECIKCRMKRDNWPIQPQQREGFFFLRFCQRPLGTYYSFTELCQIDLPFCAESCFCAGCEEYHFLHEGLCLSECPQRFYEDKEQGECLHCHPDCALCDGPSSIDCDTCMDQEKTLHDGACLAACPSHSYRDLTTAQCEGKTENTVFIKSSKLKHIG